MSLQLKEKKTSVPILMIEVCLRSGVLFYVGIVILLAVVLLGLTSIFTHRQLLPTASDLFGRKEP